MIKLTGLWKNKSNDGKEYFSGYMGDARVLIFANSYKKDGSNEPDYVLYLDEKAKNSQEKKENTFDDDKF